MIFRVLVWFLFKDYVFINEARSGEMQHIRALFIRAVLVLRIMFTSFVKIMSMYRCIQVLCRAADAHFSVFNNPGDHILLGRRSWVPYY